MKNEDLNVCLLFKKPLVLSCNKSLSLLLSGYITKKSTFLIYSNYFAYCHAALKPVKVSVGFSQHVLHSVAQYPAISNSFCTSCEGMSADKSKTEDTSDKIMLH